MDAEEFIRGRGGRRLLPVTEAEMVWLIHQTDLVNTFAFGLRGCALIWPAGEPMTESIRRLLLKRGVLNENTGGAGI